jgi:UDP-galactopyranose mutase
VSKKNMPAIPPTRVIDLTPTLICFSHLRWNFVRQRPQHLMAGFAQTTRVFFFEEPLIQTAAEAHLRIETTDDGVTVAIPHLPAGLDEDAAAALQRGMLDELITDRAIEEPWLWYYTPMSLAFSDHLTPSLVVYDCMDELASFKFAPPGLIEREQRLFECADLVFTGGRSLYEAKRGQHARVYAFPSSVDVAHFATARLPTPDAEDQAEIPHPRIGFAGVIDERMDFALLDCMAAMRPDWHFVMIGPVVKIAAVELPRRSNIHWLGGKQYIELPTYLSNWDLAMMPFALNEATRFISPTKTPEYLAAGLPVVSTPVTDVVRPYGERGMVRIADTPENFIAAITAALREPDPSAWRVTVDTFLAGTSWEATQRAMKQLMETAVRPASSKPELVKAKKAPDAAPLVFDYLVVGAGFAGSVISERLASGLNARVLLIDRRPHVGGNAYDCHDAAGILIHRYGPHIFHTNSKEVFDYLSRFTAWRPYEHRVLAHVDRKLVPIPINRTTINMLYGLGLETPEAVEAFFAARAENVVQIRTSEDVVVSTVGRELYEKFFRDYTRKQWGIDPSQLDRMVTARVPTRTNEDDRYFTDKYQAMPRHGFTRMFERMLDHPNIKIMLNTDYADLAGSIEFRKVVYTGPIDEFFDFQYGKLPYRSLRFRHETVEREWHQPVAVVNYPSPAVAYTRISEYKHLTGQTHPKTSISYEYPSETGDPYYPIPRPENAALYKQYEALADRTRGVHFAGRLATYRYYNMDQVVGQALALYGRIAGTRRAAANDRRAASSGDVAANA